MKRLSHPKVQSAARYKEAFLAINGKMHEKHREMLLAHYSAPNHTISVENLAKQVGYKSAHGVYGRLGRLLCDQLDFHPTMREHGKPVYTQVLAHAPDERSEKSWEWKLRREVIQALEELGWVGGVATQHAFILTWNPDSDFRWDGKDRNVDWYIRQTAKGKFAACTWSTGNTNSVKPGDRLYLFRQGSQRGLVGSGYATSKVRPGRKGQRRFLVDLKFDNVLPPKDMLPLADLEPAKLLNWYMPASGRPVPAGASPRLELIWQRHLARIGRSVGNQNGTVADPIPTSHNRNHDSESQEADRVLREILQRQGQPQFRDRLLAAYGGRCAITGCDAKAALEAAHIEPYSDSFSNQVSNGILLRSDIHTLFDLGLICISPTKMTVTLARQLAGTAYCELDGKEIRLPKAPHLRPSKNALVRRWKEFKTRTCPTLRLK